MSELLHYWYSWSGFLAVVIIFTIVIALFIRSRLKHGILRMCLNVLITFLFFLVFIVLITPGLMDCEATSVFSERFCIN